jgi:hypothetical protein
MAKSITWRTRIRRFLFYLSGTYLAVLSAILVPAIGIWHATQNQFGASARHHTLWWLIIGLLAGFLFIVLRNYLEYRRVIYDPHWALVFQDRFDNMKTERSAAAKILRDSKADLGNFEDPELADIDDVLDFLEDIGLYQRADHISPELAHHHFFHWTRGYWQAARTYVQGWRNKEPARWNHVEELYETICDIELSEHGGKRELLTLSEADLVKIPNRRNWQW